MTAHPLLCNSSHSNQYHRQQAGMGRKFCTECACLYWQEQGSRDQRLHYGRAVGDLQMGLGCYRACYPAVLDRHTLVTYDVRELLTKDLICYWLPLSACHEPGVRPGLDLDPAALIARYKRARATSDREELVPLLTAAPAWWPNGKPGLSIMR